MPLSYIIDQRSFKSWSHYGSDFRLAKSYIYIINNINILYLHKSYILFSCGDYLCCFCPSCLSTVLENPKGIIIHLLNISLCEHATAC